MNEHDLRDAVTVKLLQGQQLMKASGL